MTTRIDIGSSEPVASSMRALTWRLQAALEAAAQTVRPLWLVLFTVWAGSVMMSETVGGHGLGLVDWVLAADRAALGLLICFVLIPRLLARGRRAAFLIAVVGSIIAFAMFQTGLLQPWLTSQGAKGLVCFRCYLTQSLPAIASMTAVSLTWSYLEQQKQAAVTARARSDAELRFLRAQMNPHLLFNSLNNVYAYALEKSDRAPAMILKLSGVLRYMLYEAGDEAVPLSKELDYITDYVELQKLSTEGRGEVTLVIDSDDGAYRIAPLILIVLIENSFKHAVETLNTIKVRIAISVRDGVLRLETENNLSDPGAAHGGPGGIGLANVRRRLELLYPGRFDLKTEERNSAFHAVLTLTLSNV